ncbi:ribosomal protein L17 [Streptacidiphilus sp. MAP12-33]|uniref:hypothetical protein n=1 Tax=Streptacidiphilus sp. MAP12-33 TaxID=3156266 RepID=UPI0035190FAD
MNVTDLLRLMQTEHDETSARAHSLREQIERLTAELVDAEARLAELAAARKVIDNLTQADQEPASSDMDTVYQRIVTAFNEHPGRVFRVRDLHELLGLPPTSPQSTSPAPAWDDSSARESSPNPDAAATRNGLNVLSGRAGGRRRG